VGQEKAVIAEEITMTYGFVEANVEPSAELAANGPASQPAAPAVPSPLHAAVNA